MKRFAFTCLLASISIAVAAQEQKAHLLADNYKDAATGQTVRHTYWQVLERANLRYGTRILYRFSKKGDQYALQLKVSRGGNAFVVARSAPLELLLEGGRILTLYNSRYTQSYRGGGARYEPRSDAEGLMLTFPIPDEYLPVLTHEYVDMLRLHANDQGFMQSDVTGPHSELFMDELLLVMGRGGW